MNKNFALLALLAFAEAIKLDCGPCGGCGCGCDEDDEPVPVKPLGGDFEETDIAGGMQSAFMYEYEDCTGEKLELAITINPFDIKEYDVASL